MKHASLFSGIGGFDLAAQWMGWENEFHCEHNEFGKKILKHYWPKAISYDDITQTDFTIHRGSIDVLTGGFPCQPFSVSGKRGGTNDDRYLWPEMRRACQEIRPNWLVCENVTGIITMEDPREISKDVFFKVENRTLVRLQEIDRYEAVYVRQAKMLIETICEEIEACGYETIPFVIPAASVGAPHRRDRIFIVAHAYNNGSHGSKNGQGRNKGNDCHEAREESIEQSKGCGCKADATNTNSHRLQRRGNGELCTEKAHSELEGLSPAPYVTNPNGERLWGEINREGEPGQFDKTFPEHDWENWPTQPPVCGRDDGLPPGLDGITISKWRQESIKAYGNAIVPQIAYEIFKTIDNVHKSI